MKIYVIIASHNRIDLTLRCFNSLREAARNDGIEMAVVLFDDGSTDGTSQAVMDRFPETKLIAGPGSAFWAASMAAAEATVLADHAVTEEDYILWLNDDVVMDNDALGRLVSVSSAHPESVIVGAVRDPESGALTYSGLRRSGWHPLRFDRVTPMSQQPVEVDTFNGNVVLVPVTVAAALRGIDGGFSHAFADIDYGLRAQRRGTPVLLAPGTLGTCSANPERPRQTIIADWNNFTGTKGGGNYSSLSRILRRSAPRVWPLYIGTTYAIWWIRQLNTRIRNR